MEASLKSAKTGNVLPIKSNPAAPDVADLPTLCEAAAAFRRAVDCRGIRIVRSFTRGDSRVVVLGAAFAVEYRNATTLHLHLRPPDTPCWDNGDQALDWPEVTAWPLKGHPVNGFPLPDPRLGNACSAFLLYELARLFDTWIGTFLPAGYRFSRPLDGVRLAFGKAVRISRLESMYERAMAQVLPRQFLDALHLSLGGWMALPDPAAPLRIWNHHREEFVSAPAPEPWVQRATGLLKYFPADLAPGRTVEQSLKRMVEHVAGASEWRFHRESQFRFLPDVGLFDLENGHPMVPAAVKALGMRGAIAFFDRLGQAAFAEMLVRVSIRQREPGWVRFPLFIARAAAHLAQLQRVTAETRREVVGVLAGLLDSGFRTGFPRKNSTWASLVRHSQEDWLNDEPDWMDGLFTGDQPEAWESPLGPWSSGSVLFTPLATHDDLREEGREMRHCVEIWHAHCASGVAVVFRVSGTLPSGHVVRATAGFRRASQLARWRLDRILGIRNTPVAAALKTIAQDAQRAFNAQPLADAKQAAPA